VHARGHLCSRSAEFPGRAPAGDRRHDHGAGAALGFSSDSGAKRRRHGQRDTRPVSRTWGRLEEVISGVENPRSAALDRRGSENREGEPAHARRRSVLAASTDLNFAGNARDVDTDQRAATSSSRSFNGKTSRLKVTEATIKRPLGRHSRGVTRRRAGGSSAVLIRAGGAPVMNGSTRTA